MITSKNRTFSVRSKGPIVFKPTEGDIKKINYFSQLLNENFSMSEDLAKAIGTVVVQALTENAKDEQAALDIGDGDDLGLGMDMDIGGEDLPESKKDSGEVEEAEGPKNAPDLSQDFAELKKIVNNHSFVSEDEKRNEYMKKFFSSEII